MSKINGKDRLLLQFGPIKPTSDARNDVHIFADLLEAAITRIFGNSRYKTPEIEKGFLPPPLGRSLVSQVE